MALRGALIWLSARLLAAVVISSAIYSWGYNYLYEASVYTDVVVTQGERFQQFLTTALVLLVLGLFPAAIAVVISVTGRHRSWVRLVVAAIVPNVVGSVGIWFIAYAGGIGFMAVPMAAILAALGSVMFFLALLYPYGSWQRSDDVPPA